MPLLPASGTRPPPPRVGAILGSDSFCIGQRGAGKNTCVKGRESLTRTARMSREDAGLGEMSPAQRDKPCRSRHGPLRGAKHETEWKVGARRWRRGRGSDRVRTGPFGLGEATASGDGLMATVAQ